MTDNMQMVDTIRCNVQFTENKFPALVKVGLSLLYAIFILYVLEVSIFFSYQGFEVSENGVAVTPILLATIVTAILLPTMVTHEACS